LTDPVALSQSTVSHHLKQLVEAGLLLREQRGKWAYYRVVQTTLDAVADTLRPPSA
jgi:ArsR family transcriptional regulator